VLADEYATAHHEAGHCAVVLSLGWPIYSMALEDGEFLGTLHCRERRRATRDRCLIAMAGPVAQEAFSGHTDGCGHDATQARCLAAERYDDRDQQTRWMQSVEHDAERFVQGHWSPIRRLAKELLRRRTLTGKQCAEIAGI